MSVTGMKRLICIFLIAAFLLIACGTGKSSLTWQEQYDLGMQYLTEGDYEEAIVAFTAAIEIDPNQALAYVGRGDAYILSGEANDQITAAEADYLTALELDSAAAEVYGKLADVYVLLGDSEKALQILQQGTDITGDEELSTRLEELLAEMSPEEEDAEENEEEGGPFWRVTYVGQYTPDGILHGDYTYTYREDGYCSEWVSWAYSWLNGQLVEQVDWPTQFTYDEEANTVTLHYIHFGEETASNTYEWTPGSTPANQQEALFAESFGSFSVYGTNHPYGQDCIAVADLYAEGDAHDSYQEELYGEMYTVQNEWDENGCLAAAYTYNAGGELVGYMTFQYEYFDPQTGN